MIDTKALRRVAVDCSWSTSPVPIDDIINRLEAAEKERDILRDKLAVESQENGALRDSVDRACEERDALRNEIAYVKEVEFPRKAQAVADAWKGKCKRLEVERDALRAKIAAMEQQEPVRHEFQGRDGDWYPFINQRHYENTVADGTWPTPAPADEGDRPSRSI